MIGLVINISWFRQLEQTYPSIFNLAGHPEGWKKSRQYWSFVLSGSFAKLDRSDLRLKCAVLRIFFVVYLVNFSIAFLGIVVHK